MSCRILWGLILGTLTTVLAQAAIPSLSASQKEDLRYALEAAFNDVDLVIANQKANLSDLRMQEQSFQALRIFDRIPMQAELPELKNAIREHSREKNCELLKISVGNASPVPKRKVPQVISSSDFPYRLAEDQLVEKIPVQVSIRGSGLSALEWVRTWNQERLRLLAIEEGNPKPVTGRDDQWVIHATAYRFREIRYPKVVIRNPLELLPEWGRRDPSLFAKREPLLWKFVSRTQELSPRAAPLYDLRRRFQLNHARFEFFTERSLTLHPKPTS